MIRVSITDDKQHNRNILADKLLRSNYFEITFQASNGDDFLKRMNALSAEEYPHIALMDLEMPFVDGVAAIASGSALYPSVKFVVLTVFDDDDKIFNAIKAGACGYLLKEESGAVITDMLLSLWESGAGPISPSIAYKILQIVQQSHKSNKPGQWTVEENLFQLSEREYEILQLLSEGLEYKEIGSRLNISPNTVKKHTINIYQKLHVNSKAQALRIAYKKGLL